VVHKQAATARLPASLHRETVIGYSFFGVG
jgi:hypothetical protein